MMEIALRGWILYWRPEEELDLEKDHGVSRIKEAGLARGIDLAVVEPEQFQMLTTNCAHKGKIYRNGNPIDPPDFYITRTGCMTNPYRLSFMRQLEAMGVRAFNGSEAVTYTMNKFAVHQVLVRHNIPTPRSMLLRDDMEIDTIQNILTFPLVLKNVTGTNGSGICLCPTLPVLKDTFDLLEDSGAKMNQLMVQEYINTRIGEDLRVFVLGGEVIGCMRRVAKSGFKANFALGSDVHPYDPPDEVKDMAIKAARVLDLDIAGVDILFKDDGYCVLEVNSGAGFRGLEQAIGKGIAEKIIDYILKTMKKKKASPPCAVS